MCETIHPAVFIIIITIITNYIMKTVRRGKGKGAEVDFAAVNLQVLHIESLTVD